MRIYCDTSFLVSLLYGPDTGHAAALAFFQNHGDGQWLTSHWSRFETINALRQLCLLKPGPRPQVAEGLRRLFMRLHTQGGFEAVETQMEEALRECSQVSAAHASLLRMRSADVLHVALLEQIQPDLFVTRDTDQHALAQARAFNSTLV